jgi:hypothetical protein
MQRREVWEALSGGEAAGFEAVFPRVERRARPGRHNLCGSYGRMHASGIC